MQNISPGQMIAILVMCFFLIIIFGIFISVGLKDRWARLIHHPAQNFKFDKKEHVKFFDHKPMLYREEPEDSEIPENDIAENIEESVPNDDFIHPHPGVGSTHGHHIH